MKKGNRLAGFFIIAALALVTNVASASVITHIDSFTVNPIFVDEFNDGNPPPSAPNLTSGGSTAYFAPAGFLPGSESGGQLQLNSSLGVTYINAFGSARKSQFATLLPALNQASTLNIVGKFDLTAPPLPGDAYGLYALGFGPSVNRELDLMVWHGFDNTLSIFLLIQDFVNHTITPIGQAPIDFSFGKIALQLTHEAGGDAFTGSYTYLDDSAAAASPSFVLGSADIFPDAFIVQTGFFAGEATVPEPLSIALFGIGCVALSMFARRRRT